MCVQIHTHMTHTHMFTCPHTYTFFFYSLTLFLVEEASWSKAKHSWQKMPHLRGSIFKNPEVVLDKIQN